jgi:carbonic anhydrase/acetyltransferase-like protein (isoleucine patch superfamily)
VGLGAIVIVGAGADGFGRAVQQDEKEPAPLLTQPLGCVEILGCSVLERMLERMIRAEVEVITLLVLDGVDLPRLPASLKNVSVQIVSDASSGIAQVLGQYAQGDVEHAFVVLASLYAETDLLDLFYFHRESRKTVTRARDAQGPLSLWVIDCAKAQHAGVENLLLPENAQVPTYFVREYVNRVAHPRDLRTFACDMLRGRCLARPRGSEIKPGIWVDESADIHKRARIVAPAYIGRGSKIKEDTLITRCSAIERGCHVDAGTVIEDSSILPNTHIGIWLDVCHAVANGNRLLSLERDVLVKISDASVMRSNGSLRKEVRSNVSLSLAKNEPLKVVSSKPVDSKKETPAPEAWQLGANPIQG